MQHKFQAVEKDIKQMYANLTKTFNAALSQESAQKKEQMDNLYKNITAMVKKSKILLFFLKFF